MISSRQVSVSFSRVPYLFLFIALLLTPSVASIAAAQAPLAAAPSQAVSSGQPIEESKAEKKTEAEERNEYRHSATVKWFANLFHVDVETAAITLEYINFAIIVVGVGIPLFRILPKAMRKRSARLSFDLEVAQAKTDDANTRLRAVEGKLAGLDLEIAAIRKQMEEDMRGDEVQSKAQIEEETARIVGAAEQEIVMAGSLARRGLRQFAGDLAIDRALSQLTLNAETDRAMFAEFASDVSGPKGRAKRSAQGGKN